MLIDGLCTVRREIYSQMDCALSGERYTHIWIVHCRERDMLIDGLCTVRRDIYS